MLRRKKKPDDRQTYEKWKQEETGKGGNPV
jgi:hypothetical protein